MKVLIFEDNLMWSQRLRQSVAALGHEAVLFSTTPNQMVSGDVAIVNLGSPKISPSELVPMLKEAGIRIIAHAGHKEKELRELGKSLGCERIASNSELTFKLGELLHSAVPAKVKE
jgi:hypothetical protein